LKALDMRTHHGMGQADESVENTRNKEELERQKSSVTTITASAILSVIDHTWRQLVVALDKIEPVLDAGPDAGGWTPRQVLSHIVGCWQRVPVHAAFFLTRQPRVPIVFGDEFWTPEWENAPIEAFKLALQVSYEGSRVLLSQLTPEQLAFTSKTQLGEMSLGEFFMTCYVFHIADMHIAQLYAFL
jgi:hypothetical protein